MDRTSLILKIFQSKYVKFKEEALQYLKNNNLDKVNSTFSNDNINGILYGLTHYYVKDFKQKNVYELYKVICNDFIVKNKVINYSNSSLFLSLLKKLTSLDKGYLLLNNLNIKYNLSDYTVMLLNDVLIKGTLSNLLFWKKLMSNNYLFTIENLILVCRNSDYRMIKYFVENNFVENYSGGNNYIININDVNVKKILSTIALSNHIPLKFKLKRIKLLNKIIDFNNYLNIMITTLPLYMINKIHNFYNFIDYKLSVIDISELSINNVVLLSKFYNLTNTYNKSLIELLFIFLGDTDNYINFKYVIENNNLQNYIGELFCNFGGLNNPFINYIKSNNSDNFKKDYYDLMVKVMKNNFKNKNSVININNYWNSKIICDYIYFLLPFINKLDGTCIISKNYPILRRFFVKIYNKRIKYNRFMDLLNNSQMNIINNNVNNNNIIVDKTILKNSNGYVGHYFEGIITNKLPPNFLKININKAIYLEDESLYLVFDNIFIDDIKVNLSSHHEYLVKNNINLNLENYHKVLNDYIEYSEKVNNCNKWFPLIFDKLPISNMQSNNQYIYLKNLNNSQSIIIKNKENIYLKLKLLNEKESKLVDYDNNSYDDIYKIIYDKIKDNLNNGNLIIKYYPYKKDFEICYYSIKPNKKNKIDYLLNL
jgi:hypothetical protein